jgi:single-strand DNA-binding protein
LNRAAPFRFAFLSAFSVPRSKHPRPSDARSPFQNPLCASTRCGLLPQNKFGSPSADSVQSPWEWVATAHPPGKHVPQIADKPKETEPNAIINKVILIGRLGQNAEAKTAQNNREYVVLNIATQESCKNDKGDYETRTEWHRIYAWKNLSRFAKTLRKGQLITLEGTLRYREVQDEGEGTTFKHRIAEVHATSMKRLSKIETADDPSDGAGDE